MAASDPWKDVSRRADLELAIWPRDSAGRRPQLAIVGLGRIVERPWAVDRAIALRPVASLGLAADHRARDGHRGGLPLAEIERLLQEPESP